MDPGGGGFYRNVVYNDDDDVAREFQPADERRSDLHPPPPPPPPLQQTQPQPLAEILERVQITGTSGEPKIERRACDRYGDFRGSDEPMVAPRLAVAPPPPPPAPAGRPETDQISGGYGNEGFPTHGSGVGNVVPSGGASGTTLFVGDLDWWTTDAEIEAELCKYGQVKEVKYFDDLLCGKSSGFCQVDFYDPIAAAACEDGMNGHIFNGRSCVVALASPHQVRKMGERQMNKNRQMTGATEPPAIGTGILNQSLEEDHHQGLAAGHWTEELFIFPSPI